MFTFSHQTLSNGLHVIIVPMSSVESVTVLAMANTGSRYEEPREEGIAHFFEHMVFKGTQQYPDSQAVSRAIDEIGADANAFTSKEYTGYYVKAAAKHLHRALDVVSDMLLVPKLRQEDIDREKGVIIEEINMYRDTPTRYIADLFEEMVYRGSGLSHDVAGSKESVSGLNRDDFVRFLRHWYGTGNLVLVLAGHAPSVESVATMDLIKEMFAKKDPAGGLDERTSGKIAVETFLEKKKPHGPFSADRLHIEHKATEQAHLILGWPALDRRDPRRYALMLLGTVLGGNMSSRLFTEVREKRGLCYYVHSDVDFYHDGGMIGASAGVDPGRIEEAIEVIVAEFQALASGEKPITESELSKAKDYVTGTTVLNFEDSRSVAQYFGLKQLLIDAVEPPEQLLKKIQAVTAEQMHALAREFIQSDKMRLAVIGPYKGSEQFERFVK